MSNLTREWPDELLIEPIDGALNATVRLPGSKSITNRALIAAALADGTSTLRFAGLSDDTEAMIDCLRAVGATISVEDDAIRVRGVGGQLQSPAGGVDARQSGTTARFVLPLLALAGGGRIDGHPQLRDRPMGPLVEALRGLGAGLDADALPIEVTSGLTNTAVTIDASISSQFISGLLLCAPAMEAGLTLRFVGEPVSRPYIEMTLAVMAAFGAKHHWQDDEVVVEPGGYEAQDYTVEPDASTASYPLAAAAMVGGRVEIEGLGTGSIQGDVGFVEILEEMGAQTYVGEHRLEVRGNGHLCSVNADLSAMSDLTPTFAALAATAQGTSRATGIGFIRTTKESDRIAGSVAQLAKLGVSAAIEEDGFAVMGSDHHHAVVDTYEDHRMAMAFSLLGLVAEPVTVRDPGCVAKTFPGFYDMIETLRNSASTTPLVLAIDGPAGSGKSTVAASVANALRLPHLDTGAMYRAVAYSVLEAGASIDDEAAASQAAQDAEIVIGNGYVSVDGRDATDAIRTPEVTAAVSPVATFRGVRQVLTEHQRRWATERGAAVIEGRDIGTAVFPDATLKIFLTATPRERARRRAGEVGVADLDDMERRIRERDETDMNREHDPLVQAHDATLLDSTGMEIGEVIAKVVELWEHR